MPLKQTDAHRSSRPKTKLSVHIPTQASIAQFSFKARGVKLIVIAFGLSPLSRLVLH